MDFTTVGTAVVTSGAISGLVLFWFKERLQQSIRHEYEREMAKLRSDLEFDLDRRKRLYEGKLAQYKRYFAMLDGYSENTRRELFATFQDEFTSLIRDPSEENTISYVKVSLSLQGDLSQKFTAFKTELNGLRLEAGERMLSLLNEYVAALEPVQAQTVEFMQWMNQNFMLFVTNPEMANTRVQQFVSGEVSVHGVELKRLQDEIFQEMRRELGVA
jgi:hypothetical protein